MKNTKTFLKLGSSLCLGMGIILGSSIKSAEAIQNGQPNSAQCAKAKSNTDQRCADEESSETCKIAREREAQRCGQARKPDSHSPSTPPAKADPAVSGNKPIVCPGAITLQELIKLRKGESVEGWVLDGHEYMPSTIKETIEDLKIVREQLQTVVKFLKAEKITQIKGGSNQWCKYGLIPPNKDPYILLKPKK